MGHSQHMTDLISHGKGHSHPFFPILRLHNAFGFRASCDHVTSCKLQSYTDIFCKHPLHSTNVIKKNITLTESNLIERSVGWQSTHMAIFPTTHTLEKIFVYPILASQKTKNNQTKIETYSFGHHDIRVSPYPLELFVINLAEAKRVCKM